VLQTLAAAGRWLTSAMRDGIAALGHSHMTHRTAAKMAVLGVNRHGSSQRRGTSTVLAHLAAGQHRIAHLARGGHPQSAQMLV
jgi:hypothetical protein